MSRMRPSGRTPRLRPTWSAGSSRRRSARASQRPAPSTRRHRWFDPSSRSVLTDLGEVIGGVDIAGEPVGNACAAPFGLCETYSAGMLDEVPQRSVAPGERALGRVENGCRVDGVEWLDAARRLAHPHLAFTQTRGPPPDETRGEPREVH